MLRPIWNAFFREEICEKAFCERRFPNQGTDVGPEIAPQPPRCASTPQSLPLGGRTVRGTVRSGPGEATINHRWAGEAGSDEGAIWYPTFPCRKGTLSRLSPQRGFSIAPLGNPVAPSSVTFGDSFPPRGSLWVVQPYTKKRPKSGYVHGPRNSPTTGTMWHPTPKRASGNERALKMGGRGASPRDSLRPGFL